MVVEVVTVDSKEKARYIHRRIYIPVLGSCEGRDVLGLFIC